MGLPRRLYPAHSLNHMEATETRTCPAPGPSRRLNRALAAGGASAQTAVGGLGYSSWSRSDPATRYGRWDR